MTKEFCKPKIIISKCIEHDNCRFNGQIIRSDFVKNLKNFVNFIPVCAEVEIGLGIPRNPIRIIDKKGNLFLIQPETNKDVTIEMINFSNNYLDNIVIDGAILKSKSPSCGTNDVKIYPSIDKTAPIRRDKGFFGGAIIDKFPFIAIENEDRLRNRIIKEHFLKRIFIFASFRDIKGKNSINELIKFHSENKFLIKSYSQKYLEILGDITANKNKEHIEDILNKYQINLQLAFSKSPRCTSNINVLNNSFGFISQYLNSEEKKLYLKSIEDFRKGHVGISVPVSIMKSWIARFDQKYLKQQTFFYPYPDELVDVEDINFCEARDFWK